jgi:hypothetical protein
VHVDLTTGRAQGADPVNDADLAKVEILWVGVGAPECRDRPSSPVSSKRKRTWVASMPRAQVRRPVGMTGQARPLGGCNNATFDVGGHENGRGNKQGGMMIKRDIPVV